MSVVADARPKVLVVDDEPMNVELLERCLHRKFTVLTAGSAEKALDVLRTSLDVSIVLCDYRLSGMSGTQFLAECVRHVPDAKRVIITGYADIDSIIEAINSGGIHYFIKKPWNAHELTHALEGLVDVQRLEQENRRLVGELQHSNA